jgi:molybdopterin synthase catalytic subunit
MSAASAPDINAWIDEVKAASGSEGIGMILAHRGVVRGHSRSGNTVTSMVLGVDRERLEEVLADARTWTGVIAVRCWVNEGILVVGDDIMSVLIAGDIRDNVLGALERLVSVIKTEVVSEEERA